jgi:hypothetical protein
MASPILTTRALNRATLARQLLLARSDMPIAAAVRFLGGLQAQQSNDPYIALWSRLAGFRLEALTALIVERTLARATTMRGTLHLHTADDLIGFRALVAPFLKAAWKSNFARRFGDNDPAQVVKAGVRLLDKGPMTAGALGQALQERFPSGEPLAKSVLVQMHETLVQIPPTRLWNNGSPPLLSRVEAWLPPPYKRPLSRADLVRRYLAAFGPASVNDMQTWCRLTRLGAEFAAMGDELVRFEGEDGRVLYDLPDAPRPDPQTPAPVRFLPLYDNVYLGYDQRGRMLAEGDRERLSLFFGFKPAVLVDGVIAASWTLTRGRKAPPRLAIEPYHGLTRPQVREVEAEGRAFLKFMSEDDAADGVEVLAVRA